MSARRFQWLANSAPVRREALLGIGCELTGMTIDVEDG
ncbi:UNVERIFIED_ORG: hypothetical protein M2438_000341 [Methylobacterium sp. SuP10 SLI 274]|nr:hypothetical protein [Methylorubrum extorquens]MDF9789833.1 hypothetical protein [Methylorubrum extorquens]MDF9861542.1 hypothetical protein [Methylorubrum pseudosasae]MDH6635166.1 hypothetical protein [Methylobacterium sp. SuP10 SLI 274]MDH6664338.1 hypothetical protein [Methylorubrum zatmanii]